MNSSSLAMFFTLGRVSRAQDVPFQRSITRPVGQFWQIFVVYPTAHTSFEAPPATPSRLMPFPTLPSRSHAFPFQCSIKPVAGDVSVLQVDPTAQASLAAEAETPSSPL